MKKLIIYPYKMGSLSAKKLAENLNARRVRQNGRYIPKTRHIIVNWGNSSIPNWENKRISRNVKILNKPSSIALASNKLKTYYTLASKGVNCPAFTTSRRVAEQWVEGGNRVFARQLLSAHSGRGIVVCDALEDLVDAPLYTKYIKKKHEFRVHVFRNSILDYAEKKRREGAPPLSDYVRNHSMGWVFCREGILHSEEVKNLCIKAAQALGLDFAAIDAVLGHDGKPYIIEVNTAAGLEGTTLQKYTNALRSLLYENF